MGKGAGRVALVGAGPGHPGLLTLRAVACLAEADLVLYDRLVPARMLDHAPDKARRLCVDELPGCHPDRWPQIYQAMIDAARQGLKVVRLKGGDPLIFGRGGEEAEALRQAGIPYEIVPGVTAALGAGAFAGIPLTHRSHASAVAFVTGHEKLDKEDRRIDWSALARFPGTLVIYMGVARLADIVSALTAHGKPADTPAAMVSWASLGRQQTLDTTLGQLPEAVARAEIKAPAVIIVGAVAALRHELKWFEHLPLFGKRVLVTRPRRQAEGFMQQLEALGASVSLLPGVEVREPADWGSVDRAIADLSSYQWLVFTSVNGVEYFVRRLRGLGRDLRALGGLQLAAIGPATAEALRTFHLEPDLVPKAYRSEELAAELRQRVAGQRILLARADRGRDLLRDELSGVALVEQVAVYTQVDGPWDAAVAGQLEGGEIDLIPFTSSNIARSILGRLGVEGRRLIESGRMQLVTISPVTSAAVKEMGFPVAREATEYTTGGLLEAVIEVTKTMRNAECGNEPDARAKEQ